MHQETDTHTHSHTSEACGRHPQRCETSCIPHAYITPSPPPPADHSSLYHFILRCKGKAPLVLPLSPSLSLSMKPARRLPYAIEPDFVTPGASKECITRMRSDCSKSHLCWRFYVGKNWIINLHYLWQHRSWEVKPCYHPVLLIFAGENSIKGKWQQTVDLLFITANLKRQTSAGQWAVMTLKIRRWYNSKTAPPSCLYS